MRAWLKAATTTAVSLPGTLTSVAETRMTLHQSGDVTVPCAAQQIALPMTGEWLGPQLPPAFRGSRWHRRFDRAEVSVDTRVLRAADAPLGPQMVQPALFSALRALV